MSIFTIWKVVTSRPAIAVAGLVAGALLAGHGFNWREQQAKDTRPEILEETAPAAKAERVELTPQEAETLCAALRPIGESKALRTSRGRNPALRRPASSQEAAGFRLGSGVEPQLLDVLKVGELENGGELEVTLAPGDTVPTVTVFPNERRWLEGESRWRISGTYGMGKAGDAELGRAVAASVDWLGVRTGRVEHGASLIGFDVPGCSRGVLGGYHFAFE